MFDSSCSEYQRYNFLKAIHNASLMFLVCLWVVQNIKDTIFWKQFTTFDYFTLRIIKLFRISKIQFFESNSQQFSGTCFKNSGCSEYQRYNFLKAIHNILVPFRIRGWVVQNIKDTIFWKQFTTQNPLSKWHPLLFRISKIQFFESNSQQSSITKK